MHEPVFLDFIGKMVYVYDCILWMNCLLCIWHLFELYYFKQKMMFICLMHCVGCSRLHQCFHTRLKVFRSLWTQQLYSGGHQNGCTKTTLKEVERELYELKSETMYHFCIWCTALVHTSICENTLRLIRLRDERSAICVVRTWMVICWTHGRALECSACGARVMAGQCSPRTPTNVSGGTTSRTWPTETCTCQPFWYPPTFFLI